MELFYRKKGEGHPLIIVHGLYGASDNWMTIAAKLEGHFEVYMIDQRNHGRSPHSPKHNYSLMVEDLLEFMDTHHLQKAILLGHSMGGKTVMHFAAKYPERVSRLIVVDIAPKDYRPAEPDNSRAIEHRQIIDAMQAVDFSVVESRQDIDAQLSKYIPVERIRQFLLKNVHRSKDNRYSWSLNLDALDRDLDEIMQGLNVEAIQADGGITGFPALFVRGEMSNYVLDEDLDLIESLFPYAELITIPKAGHWLHAEKPDEFVEAIMDFILG